MSEVKSITMDDKNEYSGTASPEALLSEIQSMAEQLSAMDKLFKRRFDEISMEINATSQQVDMAEENTRKQFGEILQILAAISYSGDGNSQVNAGVELEAVIEDTESAANTILDAADRIADRIQAEDWENQDGRHKALDQIRTDVQEILMACTFQDLTGQRIRRTLENLHDIEGKLSTMLRKIGIDVDPTEEQVKQTVSGNSDRFSQNDIDSMFSGK